MAEVPKIVRERLRHQAAEWEAAGEHPDANLLSAFTEHALTEPERVSVLDHLSGCAACRQMVALSLPEFELEAQVAAAVPRAAAGAGRSWWRSPVVHWGALTAAALVVLIAVGERMRLREGRSASAPAVAKYEPAQQPPAAATEAAPAPPQQKESPKPAPAAPPASASNRAKAMSGSVGKLESTDKLTPTTRVLDEAAAQNAPAPAPPPATAAPEINAAQAESAVRQVPGGMGSGASAGVGRAGGVVGGIVAAAPASKSEATQDRGATLAMRASLRARWSVSDAGSLQRSFDAGRTWKEVAVADGVRFCAVAVVANDVWAGGYGGALYHSTDSGKHWSRVPVRTHDRELSGDIVRIEFADLRNGVVTTSSGETWATSDGGATWGQQ